MTNDIEQDLLNAERPVPPPALRQRVLTRASPLVQPHINRLDAIWFSRGWRLAAVVVFAGLIAADGLSSMTDGLSPQPDGPPLRGSVQVATQAAIDAGLGKADVAAIAAQAALPPLRTDVDAIGANGIGLTGGPQ